MSPRLYRAFGALALAVLMLCTAGAALLGWEDWLVRRPTRQSLETAMRIAPGDARAYAALASFEAGNSVAVWRRSVEVNPFDSKAWIQAGLEAEFRGNRAEADRCFLQAARVDKTYAPRWALANFYYRANEPAKFWPWLREAVRMSYADPQPIARLAWNMASDAPEAVDALSVRWPALARYISLLFDNDRPVAAEAAASRLIEIAGKEAVPAELIYCDRFIETGRPEAALRLWNRLASARMVPVPPLDPARGPHLTNGDFAAEFLSRGFDWRTPPTAGVKMLRLGAAEGLRFSFSGQQPEYCMLMLQRVALAPQRRWRLTFEYRSEGLPAMTGLRWRTTGAEWQAPASDDWRAAAFEFTTEAAGPVAPLVLAYERAAGTVRTEGSFCVRHVRLE